MNDRRGNPPMPWEQYRDEQLLKFAKQLVVAFFIVGPILALLMFPWGQ